MERRPLLSSVATFCHKPYAQHGPKKPDGWFSHDWGHLVLNISWQAFQQRPDRAVAWLIGDRVRQAYPNGTGSTGLGPNGRKWNERVNAPGVHDQILDIILAGLEQHYAPPAQTTD